MPGINKGRSASRAGLSCFIWIVASCGNAAGSGDWYYHWNCNGDPQCLATNPTGAPSGVLDEGPAQSACTSLMQFAARFWGAAAVNSCDHSATGAPGGGGATLSSISVTPANPSLPIGATLQMVATGNYSDGTSKNLTSQVYWSSATPAVAEVTLSGQVKAAAVGTASISARAQDGSNITGSTTVRVTPLSLTSISIAPANPAVAAGFRLQLTATGHYSDGTTHDLTAQVTWASGSSAVATMDAGGLLSGVGAGTSTVTATLANIAGSAIATVTTATLQSLTLTPANPAVAPGATLQLTALGNFSDGTHLDLTAQVTWTSGTPAVATMSGGVVSGVAPGTSIITATYERLSISASTQLTVAAGVSWTLQPGARATWSLMAVTASSGQFVAVGAGGLVVTSPDGVTWTARTSGTASTLDGVAWSGGQFAAVAGSSGAVITSPDGIIWTAHLAADAPNGLNGIAWSGTKFAAVGGSGIAVTSADGATWSGGPAANRILYGVGASGTLFAAVGPGGTLVTSPDGSAWTARTANTSQDLSGVAWAGSSWAAVGAAGTIVSSPDGINWTLRSGGTSGRLAAIAAAATGFVAVGDTILTSPDGAAWTVRSAGSNVFYGVAAMGTRLVAVGPGVIATSP